MDKTIREKMKEARAIYHMKDFRSFMRNMQGLTDQDIEQPVPALKQKIMSSRETDPVSIFERIMEEQAAAWRKATPLPTNTEWHHFLVPGAIMAALRNAGYEFTDRDLEEAMLRGEKCAGGSCGFMGTCGGAYSVGIIASLINKTNPLHGQERSEALTLVAQMLQTIARYPHRCCKRSSYLAFQSAAMYLGDKGYDRIRIGPIQCRWAVRNSMCFGAQCPFHPRHNHTYKSP